MTINRFPLFVPFATTNVALLVFGYEAAALHSTLHWAILLPALALAVVAAALWSRIIGRAYVDEDRMLELVQHLRARGD